LILIDTNVLVDLVTDDPLWAEWSQHQLDIAAIQDELAINDVVYAELSVRYARIEELDAMIRGARLVNATMPHPALFLAGKAFQRYRSAGGTRTRVLPDFFLGAHAVVSDCVLITRDAARYRTYFSGDYVDRPELSRSAVALREPRPQRERGGRGPTRRETVAKTIPFRDPSSTSRGWVAGASRLSRSPMVLSSGGIASRRQ
jgi:predicted nucleic acid-binding protein